MRELTVVCVADIHGCTFPVIPPCDILLIAGDFTSAYLKPFDYEGQRQYMQGPFTNWLRHAPARHKVAAGGNHDFLAREEAECIRSLPWYYLEDESIELEGLVIHGSPWTHPFFDWAYMLPEEKLAEKWALIPDNCDLLLTHSPPYGLGDFADNGYNPDPHTGSPSLRKLVDDHPTLQLHVFGHIHEGHGQGILENGAIWANASVLNDAYKAVFEPIVVTVRATD